MAMVKLAEKLAIPRSGPARPDPLMYVSIGALYVAGATLVVISLLLPHPGAADEAALAAIAVTAYLTGAAFLLARRHLQPWVASAGTLTGAVLVNLAVYLSGTASSPYSVMLIWVVIYSTYFFSRRQSTLTMGFVAILYGLTLALHPHPDPNGFVFWWCTSIGLTVVAALVSYLVQARQVAEAATAHLAAIVEEAGDAIYGISPDGIVETWNRAAQKLYGWQASEIVGESLALLMPDDHPDGLEEVLTRVRRGEKVDEFETTRMRKDGSRVDVALAVSPVRDDAGAIVGGSLVARDVTGRKDLERQRELLLAHTQAMARTDALTGLANRRAWDEELRRELARAQRTKRPVCVAMIDLDHFKAFNDERGHLAGDELLREAATTWRLVLRLGDLIARYGGEEFALLLPDCGIGDAAHVIERLRASTPLGQTCSAGVAAWDGSESPGELIARVDAALYEAKRAGRDRLAYA
jgi:diguanylate cyclase (GGDEF)-like protein/PAS domain S-box-containing protein